MTVGTLTIFVKVPYVRQTVLDTCESKQAACSLSMAAIACHLQAHCFNSQKIHMRLAPDLHVGQSDVNKAGNKHTV